MSKFEELLKSLDDTADEANKLAQSAKDDEKVEDAAEEFDEEDDDAGDDKGEAFGKSLGDEMVDATDLLKSLVDRTDATDNLLAKALPQLIKTMATQTEMIKSLQAQTQALASQGRGRKTMVNIAEKPGLGDMAKSQGADDGQITPQQLLAKSNAAHKDGKINGVELNTIDVCLRNGWSIDAAILQKVASA